MTSANRKPMPGDTVILRSLPLGFMDDLPSEDQKALSEVVGRPVQFDEYDDDGRAELEFTDSSGVTHFVFVSLDFIAAPK